VALVFIGGISALMSFDWRQRVKHFSGDGMVGMVHSNSLDSRNICQFWEKVKYFGTR